MLGGVGWLEKSLSVLCIKLWVGEKDMKDHDDNKEATKMDENKEALNTEKMFLE